MFLICAELIPAPGCKITDQVLLLREPSALLLKTNSRRKAGEYVQVALSLVCCEHSDWRDLNSDTSFQLACFTCTAFMFSKGSVFRCGFTARNTSAAPVLRSAAALFCPRHYSVRYTYRCSLKHQILTTTEEAGNRWRQKGTCVRCERLVYHSYDGFTVNGHANHRRDILSKVLCGQEKKGSRFTARCPEHKKNQTWHYREVVLWRLVYILPFTVT